MNITSDTSTTDTNITTTLTTTTTQETTEPASTTNVVPTTTTTIINDTNTAPGMSSGAIAGIVIGCFVVGVAILAVAYFLWRRKRKEEKRKRLNPLPGAHDLEEMNMKKIEENKKQKKSKHKKSKKESIDVEPPSNISVTSYENVPKTKKESPYANTTHGGAPASPIDEEPSSDYLEPEDLKLEYSAAGGIDYYTTKNNNSREDNYDVPSQKDKGKVNDSKTISSHQSKDYVNVPNKLPPGQAPRPGGSIRTDDSTDSQQQVYENIENENNTAKSKNHRKT